MATRNRLKAKLLEAREVSSPGDEERQDLMEKSEYLAKESASESGGDEHLRSPAMKKLALRKQVVSPRKHSFPTTDSEDKTKSEGKHVASEPATNAWPSRAKRPADSPTTLEGKHSKRGKNEEQDDNEALLEVSPSVKEGEDLMEKSEHLVKESDLESEGDERSKTLTLRKQVVSQRKDSSSTINSENKAQSKGKNIAFEPVTDALPSGASYKSLADSPSPNQGKDLKSAKKKEQVNDEAVVEKGFKKNEDTVKKQLYKKLWSEDDEATILKGLIDYAGKNGIVPGSVDMNAFWDVIKKSLHIDVSKNQMMDKVRRLRKKYQTTLVKGKNVDDRVLSNARGEVYELSKQIWGTESNNDGNLSSGVVGGASSLQKERINFGSHLKPGAKKVEMQEKWKKIKLKEMEVYLQQIKLLREVAALEVEELKFN